MMRVQHDTSQFAEDFQFLVFQDTCKITQLSVSSLPRYLQNYIVVCLLSSKILAKLHSCLFIVFQDTCKITQLSVYSLPRYLQNYIVVCLLSSNMLINLQSCQFKVSKFFVKSQICQFIVIVTFLLEYFLKRSELSQLFSPVFSPTPGVIDQITLN